jgi:D-3-phosphoglycerate dehydrogenase
MRAELLYVRHINLNAQLICALSPRLAFCKSTQQLITNEAIVVLAGPIIRQMAALRRSFLLANYRLKIVVLDDYQGAFRTLPSFSKLQNHEVSIFTDTEKDPERLVGRLKDADVVVLTQQRSLFLRHVMERLPKLKFISQTGRNVNHIDLFACNELGITVSAAGSGISPANSTAELTWSLILASRRHIPQEVQRMKEGKWQHTVGIGLSDNVLGIYSYGRVGSIVAKVGAAFGMKVLCWGRQGSMEEARRAGFQVAPNRESFFENADIVTLHLALSETTLGIITSQDLSRMKRTALLVNTSRAALIADGSLVEALKKGHPGYAAVDVYEEEPMTDANHPLLQMSNVLCTPHLGYVEQRVYASIYSCAVDQILAFAAGMPVNVVTQA